MTLPASGQLRVPPGFRFHPTDEELVNYYLRKKVASEKCDLDVIREIDLNKLEPWDLHKLCKIDSTQTEWYFFSHKDKKYPTGTRTNRATTAGFWKATGRDKAVYSIFKHIGMRKTLVFYKGRAPHGQKTDWIMHEYRMDESKSGVRGNEDGWVICRVFEKRNHQQKEQRNHAAGTEEEEEESYLCEKSRGHSITSQSFTCKEEMNTEGSQVPQYPFSQLPQLESPKINCYHPCSNLSLGVKKKLLENEKVAEYSPSYSELTGIAYLKQFISEDSFTGYADSGQLTEWGMIESSIPKEMRYNSESNLSGQIQYHPHRQQRMEYHSSHQMDLWNFSK